VTPSPSETATEPSALAARLAGLVGASGFSAEHGTVKIQVERVGWVEAIRTARDEAGLAFFSWLSAVDWSRQVAVGDPPADPDTIEERYDVVCRLSSVASADGALFVASLPKDDPRIDSLVPVFDGAAWHEREAAEMFGIDFTGHPHLVKLYLPEGFEGHPLRKSFALLSREVKPWPGTVDVEAMPSAENREAGEGGEEA
jgi:NADH-quinone oxidoreductase subunit C